MYTNITFVLNPINGTESILWTIQGHKRVRKTTNPLDVHAGGGVRSWGTVLGGYNPEGYCPGSMVLAVRVWSWTGVKRMTRTCENITFSQLRWRAVINNEGYAK